MLRKLPTLIAASIATLAFAAGPANAAELRLVSGNAPPPGRDALTEFSTNGGATWQPAYVVVGDGSYHRLPGSQWISVSSNSYTPSPQMRYRRIFDLPQGCGGATLSVRIHVDNAATVSLNGIEFGATPAVEQVFTFRDPAEGPYTTAGPFRAHGNVLEFGVRNFSGPTALDYEAVVTCAADTAPPVVECTLPDDRWYSEDVSATCTAADGSSGLADAADAVFTLRTNVPEGAETAEASTDSRRVCDRDGNCATAGPFTGLKVDRRAPSVVCASPDGLWNRENVELACTAADGGSGVTESSFTLVTSVPEGIEDANAATGARRVCDAVGNCADAGPIAGNKVDRKAPALTLPADVVAEATSSAGASVGFTASAVDGVDPAPAVACSPSSGGTFALGATAVECTATDWVGNVARGSFSVRVVDTTAPSLTLPGDLEVDPTTTPVNAFGAVVRWAATASDIVDGAPPVTCAPASGSSFGFGTTTVACSAVDAAGNRASGSFTVTVWTPAALVRSLKPHCDETRAPAACRAALEALARALEGRAQDYPARYAQLAAAMNVASGALAKIPGVPREITDGLRKASALVAAQVRHQLRVDLAELRRVLASVPALHDEIDAVAVQLRGDPLYALAALDRLEGAVRSSFELRLKPDLAREALRRIAEIRQALRALRVA